jgi:hypothetical protein
MTDGSIRIKLLVGAGVLASIAETPAARGELACPNGEEVGLQPQYHVGVECRQTNHDGSGVTEPIIDEFGAMLNASTADEHFVCPLQNHDDDRVLPDPALGGSCSDTAAIRVLDRNSAIALSCQLRAVDALNLTYKSTTNKFTQTTPISQVLTFDTFDPTPWDSWFFYCKVPRVQSGDPSGIVAYYMLHHEMYSAE